MFLNQNIYSSVNMPTIGTNNNDDNAAADSESSNTQGCDKDGDLLKLEEHNEKIDDTNSIHHNTQAEDKAKASVHNKFLSPPP
jgi:hypothetical protein